MEILHPCAGFKNLKEKKLINSDFNIFQENKGNLSEILQPGSAFFSYCLHIYETTRKNMRAISHSPYNITPKVERFLF